MTELEILNKFETGAVAELSLEELTTIVESLEF